METENAPGDQTVDLRELVRSFTAALAEQDWKDGERALREQEVGNSTRSVKFSRWTTIATAVAAAAAATAAYFAGDAVNVAQNAIDRQTKEARFAAAVEAIGGEQSAERVAGFTMLRRNVEDRLDSARDADDHLDALNLYRATLDVFETYLKSSPATNGVTPSPTVAVSSGPTIAANPAPVVRGHGRPSIPEDRSYAAVQLAGLLNADNQELVHKFNRDRAVSIDLSNAELYGQSWSRVDFSWLSGKFFTSIDLRGADLDSSHWGSATLPSAFLQCANLAGARFNNDGQGSPFKGANLHGARLAGANLRNADLRGADLVGADFTGAHIDGARLDGAKFDAGSLQKALGRDAGGLVSGTQPTSDYDRDRCLAEQAVQP